MALASVSHIYRPPDTVDFFFVFFQSFSAGNFDQQLAQVGIGQDGQDGQHGQDGQDGQVNLLSFSETASCPLGNSFTTLPRFDPLTLHKLTIIDHS